MLGEMEHRLDITLKFQFIKVSMTVKMINQCDDFHEFIGINSLQNVPMLSVAFFNFIHSKFSCNERKI